LGGFVKIIVNLTVQLICSRYAVVVALTLDARHK